MCNIFSIISRIIEPRYVDTLSVFSPLPPLQLDIKTDNKKKEQTHLLSLSIKKLFLGPLDRSFCVIIVIASLRKKTRVAAEMSLYLRSDWIILSYRAESMLLDRTWHQVINILNRYHKEQQDFVTRSRGEVFRINTYRIWFPDRTENRSVASSSSIA